MRVLFAIGSTRTIGRKRLANRFEHGGGILAALRQLPWKLIATGVGVGCSEARWAAVKKLRSKWPPASEARKGASARGAG